MASGHRSWIRSLGAAAVVVIADYILVLTDCIIAGRVIGEAALGAMNLLMPAFSVVAFFAWLLGSGVSATYIRAVRKGDGRHAADELAFLPYAMHAVRISDGRHVALAPPTDDGYRYTELVTEPRVTHGEDAGQLYLVWGIVDDAGFSHDELERAEGDSGAFTFVAKVRRETHNGVPLVCMRYEDLGLKDHTRYRYRIRHVFRDGRKGPWSKPFGGLTRESSVSVSADRRLLECGWKVGF